MQSFWKFLHLHTGSLELSQTIGFLVTSLTQALLPRLLSLARAAISRKSLGSFKLFPFKNYGGHCALGNVQATEFFVEFPRSVPQHNPVSELSRQFLQPHGLVFSLNAYVTVIFQFFLFNKFDTFSKILFPLCHYGVSMRENVIYFIIRHQHNKM